MKSTQKNIWILLGVAAILITLFIPTDPKNAVVGNFSLNRIFLLISSTSVIMLIANLNMIQKYLSGILTKHNRQFTHVDVYELVIVAFLITTTIWTIGSSILIYRWLTTGSVLL